MDQPTDITTNNINEQQNNTGCCCKTIQKLLNKVNYVHKTVSKELSVVRREVGQNRKLLLQLLNSKEASEEHIEENPNVTEAIQDGPAQLNVVEIDQFNEKYKTTFPIKDCEILIDFNLSMRSDQKFVDNLLSKFKQIKGSDESKTARKLLKELCDFRCLKDFTWQGTKKMKSFQDLHVVVELLTKVIKENYPESDAMDVLAKVV